MSQSYRTPGPLGVTLILVQRELLSKISSIWFFIVASIACLISVIYGGGFINAFETETVLVSSDPLAALNTNVTIFLGLVLGVRLASGLSWEREHRTLEVLLVGPASHATVVFAKFLSEMAVLVLILGIYWLYLLIGQPLGAGTFGVSDTGGLWAMFVYILPIMAFGVLVSSMFSAVRTAVIGYLILVGLLAFVQAMTLWLRFMPPQDLSLAMLYLRSGLEAVSVVLEKISAVAYLSELVVQLIGQSIMTTKSLLSAAALTVGTLILATYINRSRGVQ